MTRYISAALTILLGLFLSHANADPGTLNVDLQHPSVKISPTFYGLMTEEINHSYDGGLYGELIQNRIFQDNDDGPRIGPWSRATEPMATSRWTMPTPSTQRL